MPNRCAANLVTDYTLESALPRHCSTAPPQSSKPKHTGRRIPSIALRFGGGGIAPREKNWWQCAAVRHDAWCTETLERNRKLLSQFQVVTRDKLDSPPAEAQVVWFVALCPMLHRSFTASGDEFDLEYSRQIAARRVIGEDED